MASSITSFPVLRSALIPMKAILWGTLIAGVLDATDGVIAYGLRGLNPIQVLQYIASGVLGSASYQGGLAAAGLGTLIHFAIAFVVAALYVFASMQILFMKTSAIPCGLIYGAFVYLVMTYLFVAHSAIGATPFDVGLFLNGVVGHALFVGLPIALMARRVQ